MRKLSVGTLAAVLVLGLATLAFAAGPAPHSTSHAATHSSSHSATHPAALSTTGTVVAVDATAKTVTIKTRMGDETFAVAANAELVSGGKKVAISDLKAGENVQVTYTKSGGAHTATKIVVQTAAPKKPAPPKPGSH
jgi:Cu/Ag efflux protein CusF